MVAAIRNIFYLCTVKSQERHEVAASKQRFLCLQLISNSIDRIECGSSNAHKVSALEYLTARNAVSLLSKFQEYE